MCLKKAMENIFNLTSFLLSKSYSNISLHYPTFSCSIELYCFSANPCAFKLFSAATNCYHCWCSFLLIVCVALFSLSQAVKINFHVDFPHRSFSWRKKNTQKRDRDGYTKGKKMYIYQERESGWLKPNMKKLVHRYCCA